MHPTQRTFAALQLVGGPAVLGSYLYSFSRWPALVGDMWGGVPDSLRFVYTAWMFVAAAGYLTFTALFFFRTDPEKARVYGVGYGILNLHYALVLLPSAAWMPLTGLMLENASGLLWWPIKIGLWLTLAGSLGLLASCITLEPRWPRGLRALAIAGALAFCFQTVVLDGLVWVALFTPPA